jgi:hypothetical protein
MDNSRDLRPTSHKDCKYFNNVFCAINGIPVDPFGFPCPRFSPKKRQKKIKSKINIPRDSYHYKKYPLQIE